MMVHIVYMEVQPESSPELGEGTPKYTGIGWMMVAYGIRLSIDNGLTGDVVLETKTTKLAQHLRKILERFCCLHLDRLPRDI